ncbi:ArnT family glycosyltransferase [Aurantiacibacter arachoides]|nr:glycosyltransferase family 39 protein [Aurantiacibacter arachoides]
MMTAPTVPGKRRWSDAVMCGDVLCYVLLALLVIATRGIWFGDPVADFDEQLYSYIGWRMTQRELPFVDWWDRKPFGLFAIFALSHALFGPGALAYQFVGALFAFASAVLTYRLARKLASRSSATIAAAIQTMLMCAYASYSAQSEVFFLPLVLGMALLLVDGDHPRFTRRAMVAMLLGGLALQVKYTVLPQCVFFGSWALWVEHRRGADLRTLAGRAILFVMAGLMPTIAVGLFYLAVGHFDAFLHANFFSFFNRDPGPEGRWASEDLIGTLPLSMLAACGFYAAFRMKRPEPIGVWLFFAGWSLAGLASVFLPREIYLYYYAALSAPVALVAVPILDRTGPLRAYPGVVLTLSLALLLQMPQRARESQDERQAANALAAAIAPHVSGSRCLWLWDGPTALYRMTRSCVPTAYVYPDHLNNSLEDGALPVDQVQEVARVLATRPGVIVTADRPMTLQNETAEYLVEGALAAHYERGVTVPMHGRQITAWTRKDPSRGPATTATGPSPR